MRLPLKDLLIFFLFIILVIVWFHDAVFYDSIFTYADLGRYFYPLREYGAQAVKAGRMPLWNPYIGNGTPFLATLQSCVFYPVSIICYILPSFDKAFNWFIIAHFILAGIFMYLLMRHWRFSRTASSISGLVFTFGGYLNSVISMNTSLSSVIWLPLIFLFFDKALREEKSSFAVITSLFLGIQFLGGEPTVIYCTAWILFFYWLGYTFFAYKDKRDLKVVTKLSGLFLTVSVLWIFITMIQLLPFAELLSLSTRAGSGEFGNVTKWSLSPLELLSFLVPYIFGNITIAGAYLQPQEWLASFYIGILPVILVFSAVLIKAGKKAVFFAILLTVSLLLALGRFTPFYMFLHKFILGFGYIRYPVKFVFITSFALSALSGMGYDTITERIKEGNAVRAVSRGLILINGLIGLIIMAFLRFWVTAFNYFADRTGRDEISGLQRHIIVFLSDSANLYRLFIIFTAAACVITLFLNGKIRRGLFAAAAVSLIFLDLAGINMGLTKVVEADLYKKEPFSYLEVKKDKWYFRVICAPEIGEVNKAVWGRDYGIGQFERKATFAANMPMSHGIYDAHGYESLYLRDARKTLISIIDKDVTFGSGLIDLLNIRYVVTADRIEAPRYTLIFQDKVARFKLLKDGKIYENYYIYRNDNAMERVFLVKEYQAFYERDVILSVLKHKEFDPARLALLEEEPRPLKGGETALALKEGAHILRYSPEEVIVEAHVNEPKFLVLSDTYYPGWKVFVDDKEDKLYRAYYSLRAVRLDRGSHIVKFIYDPLSYKIGKYVSLVTLALLAIYAMRLHFNK